MRLRAELDDHLTPLADAAAFRATVAPAVRFRRRNGGDGWETGGVWPFLAPSGANVRVGEQVRSDAPARRFETPRGAEVAVPPDSPPYCAVPAASPHRNATVALNATAQHEAKRRPATGETNRPAARRAANGRIKNVFTLKTP
jgi:hypothetical protein